MSPVPDISVIPHEEGDMFAVLACDGIWDVVSNQECADFLLAQMRAGKPLGLVCEGLLAACLAKESRDNMTVCIVLLPGAPKEVGTAKPAAPPRSGAGAGGGKGASGGGAKPPPPASAPPGKGR